MRCSYLAERVLNFPTRRLVNVSVRRLVKQCGNSPSRVKGVRLTTVDVLGLSRSVSSSRILRGSGLQRSNL